MIKEEKIKEAWGKINDKINENGWFYFGYACNGWEDVECWLEDNNLISDESYYDMTYDQCDNGDLICVQIRPKTLQGIETNNGWIKIESEYDINLFKDKERYFVFIKTSDCNESKIAVYSNLYKCFIDIYNNEIENVTHYQPIEKPKPPIY